MNTKAYDKLMKSYSKKYGDFVLSYHASNRARWIYVNYGTEEYYDLCTDNTRPNHRTIFPDEIVIDIDIDDPKRISLSKRHIISRLKEMDMSYSVWKLPSGKYHIHVFFNYLNRTMPMYKRKLYKEYLLYHIVGKMYMSLGKIDRQLIGKHSIRAEYGLYEKNVCQDTYKELVTVVDTGKANKMPIDVLKDVKRKIEYDKNTYKEYKSGYAKCYGNGKTPECIKTLLSEDFSSLGDGRDRALFVLTYWFKKTSKNKEEWVDKLVKYNKYNLNNYLNPYHLKSKINYREKSKSSFSHKFVHNLLDELRIKHECKENCSTPL